MTSIQHSVNTLPCGPKPRPIPGFKITRGVLRAMSPIHRMAAQTLISKGKWVLVDDSEEQESAGVPGTHSCRTDYEDRRMSLLLSTANYKNRPISPPWTRGSPVTGDVIEPVTPLCESCSTKCGSYLLSNAPCPVKRDRGCLLLKNPRFRLVTGDEVQP